MRKYDGADMHTWTAADRAVFEAADGKAEYEKCVAISTKASIREMILPGLIAILAPVVVGFGPKLFGFDGGGVMLGGLLAGVTVSGVLMAIFQSNAGGAWDNAKKMFEEGVNIKDQTFYKGSEPHKAAVVGDTVGDPFKDTSGPSPQYSPQADECGGTGDWRRCCSQRQQLCGCYKRSRRVCSRLLDVAFCVLEWG